MIIATCTGSIYRGEDLTKRIYKLNTGSNYPFYSLYLSMDRKYDWLFPKIGPTLVGAEGVPTTRRKGRQYFHLIYNTKHL